MKKIVLWLIKVFKLDIVTKEVIVEEKYITKGTIKGDVIVEGDLQIEGKLTVTGEITCFSNLKV